MLKVLPGVALLLLARAALAGAHQNNIGGGNGNHNGNGNPPTQIDEVVLYAVDGQTHELIRYWFGADNPMVIGRLAYSDGTTAASVKCLGFVPSGPHKGLYGVDNYDGNAQSRLVKINVFTATATPVADLGFGNVEGMVAAWDSSQNKWCLYATHSGGNGEQPSGDGGLQIKWWVDDTLVGTLAPPGTWIEAFNGWHYSGQGTGPGAVTLTWDANLRSDWLLSGGFAVVNPTGDEVEVVIEVTAPLSVLLESGTQMQGSAALGLTADSGGGTLAALGGQPVWQAMIDGAAAMPTLYPAPYDLTVAGVGSAGDSVNFGPVNGPPAAQSIGIRLGFSLTPYDLMSSTGVFSVGGEASEIPSQNLIRIDPATGSAAVVRPLAQRFEGLARAHNGILYASRDHELWSINLFSGALAQVGAHPFAGVEALEFAFGDDQPRVSIPGVPAPWTMSGALFGFSDAADGMVVINPVSGQAADYPCGIGMENLQGIVFLTQMTDPFGDVIAVVGD